MKEELSRFFRPINPDLHIEDSDYAQLQVCVSMAEAMARSTNSSLYIIDYNRKNFLYVSPNPLFLCGYSPDEVRKKGYAFYMDVVPADEIQMLFEINEAGFKFYDKQPKEKKLDMTIEYDFHIKASDGHLHLIHHKLTPILLNSNGDMWLALCSVSLSPRTTVGNVIITCKDCTTHYSYSFEGKRWREQPNITLAEREKDILQLSVKGFSNTEIAEKLFIDVNTVKYHKKNLFYKLHAENITEAIGIATNLRLI